MTETAPAETETRPLRVCELCGQIDDHPRAVHMLVPGDENQNLQNIKKVAKLDFPDEVIDAAIRELEDTTSQMVHMDCCAARGCPSEGRECEKVLAVTGPATGPALVEKLITDEVSAVGRDLHAARELEG